MARAAGRARHLDAAPGRQQRGTVRIDEPGQSRRRRGRQRRGQPAPAAPRSPLACRTDVARAGARHGSRRPRRAQRRASRRRRHDAGARARLCRDDRGLPARGAGRSSTAHGSLLPTPAGAGWRRASSRPLSVRCIARLRNCLPGSGPRLASRRSRSASRYATRSSLARRNWLDASPRTNAGDSRPTCTDSRLRCWPRRESLPCMAAAGARQATPSGFFHSGATERPAAWRPWPGSREARATLMGIATALTAP